MCYSWPNPCVAGQVTRLFWPSWSNDAWCHWLAMWTSSPWHHAARSTNINIHQAITTRPASCNANDMQWHAMTCNDDIFQANIDILQPDTVRSVCSGPKNGPSKPPKPHSASPQSEEIKKICVKGVRFWKPVVSSKLLKDPILQSSQHNQVYNQHSCCWTTSRVDLFVHFVPNVDFLLSLPVAIVALPIPSYPILSLQLVIFEISDTVGVAVFDNLGFQWLAHLASKPAEWLAQCCAKLC